MSFLKFLKIKKKIQICYISNFRFFTWFQTFETQCIEVLGGFLSLAIFMFIKEVTNPVIPLPGNPLREISVSTGEGKNREV